MKKQKLSKLLLVSFIIGILYLGYSAAYWTGAITTSGEPAEQVGGALATAIVAPHLIATTFAVLFNCLGLFMRSRGFALAGAILYTVAIVLFPMYFMFVTIEAILSYIGFAKMKKETKKGELKNEEDF